jgi:hypothetical protein
MAGILGGMAYEGTGNFPNGAKPEAKTLLG